MLNWRFLSFLPIANATTMPIISIITHESSLLAFSACLFSKILAGPRLQPLREEMQNIKDRTKAVALFV